MERYRVLRPPVRDEAGLLLSIEEFAPVSIAPGGHDADIDELPAGFLVDAEIDWSGNRPTVDELAVVRRTLFTFADEVDPMFEAARETWEQAQRAGDGMNSRVTRNTDNAVNGVLYTFAEGPDTDRFEEFRTGERPLDPLLDRVNESRTPAPREVFVLRPDGGDYVVVTITLDKGGQFADTIRETYDRPRPAEPTR